MIPVHPPVTIAEIARMAAKAQPEKWGDAEASRRMRRHLLTVNEQVHGMLLVPAKGSSGAKRCYRVHLSVLQRLCPEWFAPVRSLEGEIEELRESRDEHEAAIATLARAAGQANANANAAMSEARRASAAVRVIERAARGEQVIAA